MSNIKEAIKIIDQHAFKNKGVDEWEQMTLLKLRFKVMDIIKKFDTVDKLTKSQIELLEIMNEVLDTLFFQYQKTQNQSFVISDLKILNNSYKDLLNKMGVENIKLQDKFEKSINGI